MTTAYWTILVAILMPWALAIAAKAPAARQGKYDNRAPRTFLSNLEGYSQRANWAQQNSFEILPAYVAAVIIAHLTGAEQNLLDTLALAFIASRLIYTICYLKNWPALRSIVWIIGLLCIIALFAISAGK